MPSHLFRSVSLDRGSRRATTRQRRERNLRPRLAIDQLESRIALAITTPLSIGGTTVGTFLDAPTGAANLSDFVTVSIEGTSGTVIFNGGAGVADGTDIQSIEIVDASPDFQLTFNATITTASPVPYGSDGVIQLGQITTANVIRGINTVRGPLTGVASPWEIRTSAIHLYTFNEGSVSGSTVTDVVGSADGTLVNGASVSGGQLVLAENPGPATGAGVQYMQMPAGVLPHGSSAATFELWFTASNSTGVWGRGFDIGKDDQQYLIFTPLTAGGGSRAAITEGTYLAERSVDGVTPYNDNTQHLATVTVDDANDTLTYYIDGVSLGSVSLADTFLSGLDAINNFLGRSQYAQDPGFIGSINQFAIYDRVLSALEVAENFAFGPIVAPLTPLGFTQATPGSDTLQLEGNQTPVFAGQFVCATPLLPATTPLGAPTFAKVVSFSFDAVTNKTTLQLDRATSAGTTAGALTLTEIRQPTFRLQSFVGVNFSNRTLQEGGGLFVDVVEGADITYRGETIPNVGILLSKGLLAYSTISIREQLAGVVFLGVDANASTDGRMFVESATPESGIFVGAQRDTTALNSKFQLTGGSGEFAGGVLVRQVFNGVVNLGNRARGSFVFTKNIGPQARLNARTWGSVLAGGDFAGTINSWSGALRMTVGRNLTGTARVNSESDVSLLIGGSVLKGAVVSADEGTTFAVRGNVLGTIQAGSSLMSGTVAGNVSGAKLASSDDIELAVAGSILNSTIAADDEFTLAVARNVTGSTLSSGDSEVTFAVAGNVANSRFLGGLSGTIGGNATNSFFVAKGVSLDNNEDPDVTLDVAGSMTSCHVEATSQVTVNVDGSITKSKFISTTSDVTVSVRGDIRASTLISADDGVTLAVGRDALNVTIVGDDNDTEVSVQRNFSGSVQNASEDLLVNVGGSVLKGSTFTTGGNALIDVGGNFDGSVTSESLRFFVDGNVAQASRIVAAAVTDWQNAGNANFGVGGRFDGILNATLFDASTGLTNVTLVGGGVGSSGRFNVELFDTDNLFFNGNFNGNLRVGQDLLASLNFGGNVDRITIGGRVGSYGGQGTLNPVPVAIKVDGRLRYLNSNSYFQAAVPGRNGTFFNDALGTQSTGVLSTGGYTTVVPTLQIVPGPTPPSPQVYTAPTAPQNLAASATAVPLGIRVTFDAPSSNGGLPVVFYEYSTDATAGSPNWRRFDNPAQGPGANIPLTVDSAGGAWIPGNTYQVSVRAVNAIGPGPAPTAVPVTV